MSTRNKIFSVLLGLMVLGLSVGIGAVISCDGFPRLGEGPDLIEEAWSEILANYVERDELDTTTLSHGAIEGMMEALDDPYSFFMTPEEYEVSASDFEGEFEGIGAYVSVDDSHLIITSTIAGSPAEQAGIIASDIILEIEGEPVENMTFTEALLKIRGPEGTSLNLLIVRENIDEPFIINITRGKVEVASVMLEMEGDFAHIIITNFTDRTGDEMSEALDSIDQATAKGIILDVRGNPGGTVASVILVASHFFTMDLKILDIRDNGGNITTYNREEVLPLVHLPVLVLVDKHSASGSEVLAGALQDHDRATIAGQKTFGKGSVNNIISLNDGSAIFLTVARWLTPDGHLIEGQGIEPDIEIDLTGDDAVQWAIDYLENN